MSLPEGYDTQINELGSNLSDGENNVSVLHVHSYTMPRLSCLMSQLVI